MGFSSFGFNDVLYLLEASLSTLGLTLIAFVGAAVMGVLVALASLSRHRALRAVMSGYVIVFQGTPLLLQLFIVFFVPNSFGVTVTPLFAAGVGLTLNGGAFLGEIWRGGLRAIPRGQWEVGATIGLTFLQQCLYVLGPQAIRLTAPATVGFLVQFLKATSLAAIIGFTELTRAGQIVTNSTFQPLQVFGCVAVIYFVMCFPLTLASRRLEERMIRG